MCKLFNRKFHIFDITEVPDTIKAESLNALSGLHDKTFITSKREVGSKKI